MYAFSLSFSTNMPDTLAPVDDVISSFLKQARAGADAAPPKYSGPQEDLPKYEPGPGQSPAVAPDLKFMDIITDAVSSPAGKNALQKAIDELGDSAFSIEVCFTNVARGLANAVAVASTQEQREAILQFQGEWDQYRKVVAHTMLTRTFHNSESQTYIDLLWSSRVVAGHARTAAKGRRTFLKLRVKLRPPQTLRRTSLASSRTKALAFRIRKRKFKAIVRSVDLQQVDLPEDCSDLFLAQQLAEDIKNSQNLSQGFLDLQTNVTEFQERVSVWLQGCEKIEQRVEQLLVDIETTNQAIKKSGFIVMSLFSSC